MFLGEDIFRSRNENIYVKANSQSEATLDVIPDNIKFRHYLSQTLYYSIFTTNVFPCKNS